MSRGAAPDGVIFDLDGVITFTAGLHFAAWKESFDGCLRARARAGGAPFRPFTEEDYRAHVDGRPRLDGVRAFLAARGIDLPEGEPGNPPGCDTVHGLAERKNALFRERLRREGVDVDREAVRLVRELREAGVRVGVATSSKNMAAILEAAGLEDLFQARVDGVVSDRLGLRGKPAPDIFVACLERLGLRDPVRAAVVEDAVAGVEAGRAGGFGLVLGVDRGGRASALREHGADRIVSGFSDLTVERLRSWFDDPMNERRFARPDARAAVPGADPWVLAYDGFDPDREGLREALCALGNGHFVTRGAAEEATADDVHYPGTYVAGGYNRVASEVTGHTVVNEDLVNFPNWLPVTFRPEDGDWLALGDMEILAYRQALRLRDGVLVRRFRIRDAAGRETRVESRRLVSMAYPHLAAIDYRVTPENWAGHLRIRSALDGSVRNTGVARYRQLANRHIQVVGRGRISPEGIYLIARTTQSRFEVGEAARTRVSTEGNGVDRAGRADAVRAPQGRDVAPPAPPRRIVDEEPDRIGEEVRARAAPGETVRAEKVVALFSSHDRGIGEPGREARLALRASGGFDRILHRHRRAWRALWRRYDVELGDDGAGAGRGGSGRPGPGDRGDLDVGPPTDARDADDDLARTQLILRLHIFHLLQTVSPHTVGLDVGAPARGLHGEAYRGHVFWDELFVLPFYNLRQPSITRSLLLYRYHRLDAARELAREGGYAGAMYPWQSGHDGREATQQLHLNPLSGEWGPDWSRLQRHVNAAVVYNVWRYWRATGDREFLGDYGAEMVLEIARFWASITTWNEARGRYEIVGVMGPDEYHEKYPDAEAGGLRNNAYTNVMASWCLRRAVDVMGEVGQSRRAELRAALEIGEDEPDRWRRVADRMFVPFIEGGVIEQFEGYAALEPFDWEGYRERYGDIERLDRILKAEGDSPDRYQVSKQADATMLFYLFEPHEVEAMLARMGYEFDRAAMARTIDYYGRRTSHGSTLSKMVFASVIHHLDCEEGCRLFLDALRSDVEDVQGGTTPEGIHLGAMAGTVAILLRRYAGVELTPEGIGFDPELPSHLRRIHCRVHWRGRWLDVELTRSALSLTADRDRPEPVPVRIANEWREVEPGGTLEATL